MPQNTHTTTACFIIVVGTSRFISFIISVVSYTYNEL